MRHIIAQIRRKCSAYRRRQNLYAKKVQGLNRAITVQRLIHKPASTLRTGVFEIKR